MNWHVEVKDLLGWYEVATCAYRWDAEIIMRAHQKRGHEVRIEFGTVFVETRG
jgi:hypothetical protein